MTLIVTEYSNDIWDADYEIQVNWLDGIKRDSEGVLDSYCKYSSYTGSYQLSSAEIEYLKELKQIVLEKGK